MRAWVPHFSPLHLTDEGGNRVPLRQPVVNGAHPRQSRLGCEFVKSVPSGRHLGGRSEGQHVRLTRPDPVRRVANYQPVLSRAQLELHALLSRRAGGFAGKYQPPFQKGHQSGVSPLPTAWRMDCTTASTGSPCSRRFCNERAQASKACAVFGSSLAARARIS